MMSYFKQFLALTTLLLIINAFFPIPNNKGGFAGGLEGIEQTVSITYQKGDGKSAVSETDDGTIASRYIEESITRRPRNEFESLGKDAKLELKRLKEKVGSETTIDTKRLLVRFPNIIGNETDQIPPSSTIKSATLKLTLSFIAGPENIRVSAYRVIENWVESESGYLESPSWQQKKPSLSESENLWINSGADAPTSADGTTILSEVVLPRDTNSQASFDITRAVQTWANGETNNGLMFKLYEETTINTLRIANFYSSEWEAMGFRPKLEVSYTPKIIAAPPTPVTPPPPPSPIPSPIQEQTPLPPPPPAPTPMAPTPIAPAPVKIPTPPKPVITPPPAKPATQIPLEPQPLKPPPPTPDPEILKQEEESRSFLSKIFVVTQKRLLETWESIINIFR